MTRFAVGIFAALLVVASTAAQDKPDDIIKKAIEAHGGEAALKKYPAGTSKITGNVVEPKLPFTGSMAFSVPGKVRIEMIFEVAGQKATTIQVINGDKVSQTENGMASKLSDAVADELRESAKIQEMSLLYPLLDAKKYTVSARRMPPSTARCSGGRGQGERPQGDGARLRQKNRPARRHVARD